MSASHFLARAVALLIALHVPLPLATSAEGPDLGVATTCTRASQAERKLPPETVLQLQNALAYFGFYSNRFDGVFGTETRQGLANYCVRRGLNLGNGALAQQALLDALLRDSAVERVHAHWQNTVASEGFGVWLAQQKEQDELRVQLKSASAAQVIDILNRYLKFSPARPPALTGGGDDQTVSYRLDEDDYASLVAQRGILDKLAKLKGRGYMDPSALGAALAELFDQPTDLKAASGLVEQHADVQSLVILGPQGLARLKAARVPTEVIDLLGELQDPGYSSYEDAEKGILVALASSNKDASPMSAALAHWAPMISGQLEETRAYSVSNAAWSRIAKAVGDVPTYVPDVLQGMQQIEYPLRGLFASAVQARMTQQLQRLLVASQTDIKQYQLQLIDDAFFERMQQASVHKDLLTLLSPLKDKTFDTSTQLSNAVDGILTPEIKRIDGYAHLLAQLARKSHAFDPSKRPELTAIHDCQCLPSGAKGTVYAFAPFWWAGQAPALDFGSISRIGFYALGIGNDGHVQLPMGQPQPYFDAAFAQAKRHGTSTDIVVSKRDWRAWSGLSATQRTAAFDTLSGDIVTLLGLQSSSPLYRSQSYITLGMHQPMLVDGVTLFIENYPDSQEQIEELYRFISALRNRLAPENKFVNLMLAPEALGKGAFAYDRLAKLLRNDQGVNVPSERLLILIPLQEPYTETKKVLRQNVERSLHGAARRNLLRTLVPVIVPNDDGLLSDHFVYMGDNFGGIGIWPASLNAQGQLLSDPLTRNATVREEFFSEATVQSSALCSVICPNRWWFRIGLAIFFIATVISLGAWLWCCECRGRLQTHMFAILACTALPLVLIFLALLSCDPGLSSISQGNGPLILLLLAIAVYAWWKHTEQRKEIP